MAARRLLKIQSQLPSGKAHNTPHERPRRNEASPCNTSHLRISSGTRVQLLRLRMERLPLRRLPADDGETLHPEGLVGCLHRLNPLAEARGIALLRESGLLLGNDPPPC